MKCRREGSGGREDLPREGRERKENNRKRKKEEAVVEGRWFGRCIILQEKENGERKAKKEGKR